MADDTLTEIQNALIRKLAPWLVAGVVGSSLVGSTGMLRYDKFGRDDYDAMIEEHIIKMERYIKREIQHAEILLRAEMPPEKTKAKIRALEASAQRTDPEYKPVYEGW